MAHFGGFAPLPLRLGGSAEHGWTAAQHARFAADWVALQRVAPFAVLTFLKAGATVTVENYTAMHGSGAAVAPTPTVVGAGEVIWDWPRVFTDAFGVESPVRLLMAKAWAHGTVAFRATGVREAAARVRTRGYDAIGLADGRITLAVW